MKISTRANALVGKRLRYKDAILLLCGAILLIGSLFLFYHHSSALGEHTEQLHSRPVFTARDTTHPSFKPLSVEQKTLELPDIKNKPISAKTLGQRKVMKLRPAAAESVAPAVTQVDEPPGAPLGAAFNGTASAQPSLKDLSFGISPKCRSFMSSVSVMTKQWAKARAELGIVGSLSNNYAPMIRKFYAISFGILTISVKAKPLSYVMIWKCANDAIRKNLMAYEKSRPVENPRRAVPKLLDRVESHSIGEYTKKLSGQFGTNTFPKAFTFAREPISHFISGLSEYYWRNYQKSVISTEDLKNKLDGMFRFTQLNERKDSITDKWQKYVLWHFFAMSGVLRPGYNIGYLGKLESFDEDWKTINKLYKIDVPINRSLGWHESSDDPNGVKAAFKDLFKRDVRYKKALCHLLYVDYVCFNYDLPPECAELYSS